MVKTIELLMKILKQMYTIKVKALFKMKTVYTYLF